MAANKAPEIIIKAPAEVKLCEMDFTNDITSSSEAITGISSVTITPGTQSSPDLNEVSTAQSGKIAQVTLQEGLADVDYEVVLLVTTDGGQTLQGRGTMRVKDSSQQARRR